MPEPARPKQQLFVTTRWSVVLAAQDKLSPDSAAALESLCRTYWYPLYVYVRGCGHAPEDAQDLTQEFFARFLGKDWLRVVLPEKGRFRTFLLVTLKRFLANEWARASRKKRGGGTKAIPLDAVAAECRYAREPSLGPDELYERQWAMTLLDQSLDCLNIEYESANRGRDFEVMKEWLAAGRGEIPYAAIAEKLSVNEGAARVAVHRLRKRFRHVFREKVAETVAAAGDVDVEMRYLALVLSKV